MALRGATLQIKRLQLAGRHVDLAREVCRRVVGDFVQPAREPSTPEQEFQQHSKPESGRAGLVAQLVQLVADQREMVDDVIEAQVARHRQRPIESCDMLVMMPTRRTIATASPASDRAGVAALAEPGI